MPENASRRFAKFGASIRDEVKDTTGRSLHEWVSLARQSPTDTVEARRAWLQEELALPEGIASLVAVNSLRNWGDEVEHFAARGEQGLHYGDQWGDIELQPELAEVRRRYVDPYVSDDAVCVEIGSGGGRWTVPLLVARRVYCVEVSESMVGYLRRRFHDRPNVECVLTSGADLPGVPSRSVDFIFSYGTFLHFEPDLLAGYVASMAEVARPGAVAVLQISDTAKPEALRRRPTFTQNSPGQMASLLEPHGGRLTAIDRDTLEDSTIIVARFG